MLSYKPLVSFLVVFSQLKPEKCALNSRIEINQVNVILYFPARVVDKTRPPATSKKLTVSPSANHACRIWPNFTDFWKPCFIHYYILALNLIKIKIKIKNKTKNQKIKAKFIFL